jgi:hypothetical protein
MTMFYRVEWTELENGRLLPRPIEFEKDTPFFKPFWECRYNGGLELATLEGTALFEVANGADVAVNDGGAGPLGDLGVVQVTAKRIDKKTISVIYEVQE